MAENTEKSILIEVDLNIDKSLNDITVLRSRIQAIQELIEQNKDKKFLDENELEKYNQELKVTNKEIRSLENVTQKAIQANELNNNSIEKSRLALSVVSREWARAADLYGKNSIEAQKLAAQKKELTEAIKAEEKATGDSRRNVGNYPFQWITDGWAKVAVGVGAAITAVKGIASAFSGTINVIKDFQTATNELGAITGVSGSGLVALQNAAIEMSTSVDESGTKINKSATEILQAFQKVGSAKPELLDNAEALKEVTKNAIILSQAGGRELPLDAAVKALTQTMNQFDAKADESTRFINVLAAGAKFGAGEIPYLNDAMVKVGVTASNAGLSVEQTAAAIEVFAEKGLQAEIAGTGFKTLLVKLQADTKNYKDGVFDLNLAIKNNASIADNSTIIAKKYGLEQLSVATILFKNETRLNDLTKAMTGTNTAFEQSQQNTKGLAFEMSKLGNSWDAFVLSIDKGEGFLGKTVENFVKLGSSILGIISPINSLSDAMIEEQVNMNQLVSEITSLNENNIQRIKLTNELKEKYPEFINLIGNEKVSNEELQKALLLVNDQYRKKIELQTGKESYQSELNNLKELEIRTALYARQLTLISILQKARLENDQKQMEQILKQFNEVANKSFASGARPVFLGGTEVEDIEAAKSRINEFNNYQKGIINEQKANVDASAKIFRDSELKLYNDQLIDLKKAENEKNEYKRYMINQFLQAFKNGNNDLAAALKNNIDNYKEVTVKGVKETNEQTIEQTKKQAEKLAKLAKDELDRKIKDLDYAISLEKARNKDVIDSKELYEDKILQFEKDRLIKSAAKQQEARDQKLLTDKENEAKYKYESELAAIELDRSLTELDNKSKDQKAKRQENADSEALKKKNKADADILKAEEQLAEMQKKIQEGRYEAAKAISAGLLAITKAALGEQSGITKAAGLIDIAISTTVAAMRAFTSAQSLPTPYNYIVGAAGVAAAVAQGAAQTSALLAVPTPSGGGYSGVSVNSKDTGSTGTTLIANTTSTRTGYTPTNNVNSGIVSGQTVVNNNTPRAINSTVLVVDDVTNKQNVMRRSDSLGVI